MSFIDAFGGVFSIMILVAVGIFLHKLGAIDETVEEFITKFALKITIPLTMFINGINNVSKSFLKNSWRYFLIAFAAILISYILGYLSALAFKVKKNERGICAMVFSLSNTIFIGLPVCTYYLGSEATSSIITYYMANTIVFWTIGTNMVAADVGEEIKFNFKTIKSIFSPPVMGFVIGGALALLTIKLPKFILDPLTSIGNMTTPLVTILTGVVISKAGFTEMMRFTKTSTISLMGRFIVSPLITLTLILLFQVPPLTAKTFILQAAMPVMNQSLLIAKYYKSNDKVVAQALAVSIIIMLITTPLYVILGNGLFG